MPFYDYKCKECGKEFETFHRIFYDKKPPCPRCDSNNTHKVAANSVNLNFKGNGFYETDYKDKGEDEEDNNE